MIYLEKLKLEPLKMQWLMTVANLCTSIKPSPPPPTPHHAVYKFFS
jgi:hypothetical protein